MPNEELIQALRSKCEIMRGFENVTEIMLLAADRLESLTPRPIEEAPIGEAYFTLDDFGNPIIKDVTIKPRTFVKVSAIATLFGDIT